MLDFSELLARESEMWEKREKDEGTCVCVREVPYGRGSPALSYLTKRD